MTAGVYLLHFNTKYKHAGHYLGYAKDIDERVEAHRAGHGARLTSVINLAGITFQVARIWKGESRKFERKLKNQKNSPKLCPICREAQKQSKKQPKEVAKVAAQKLTELMRAGVALHPQLTSKMVTMKHLRRGAYAQEIDDQIYTSAIGAAYTALWNDAPVGLLNDDVVRVVLEATGLQRTFVKQTWVESTHPEKGYPIKTQTWVTCAPDDSGGQSIPARIQDLEWNRDREYVIEWLERLGL